MTPFICQIHIEKVYRISRGSTRVHLTEPRRFAQISRVNFYKIACCGTIFRMVVHHTALSFRFCGPHGVRLDKNRCVLLCIFAGYTVGFHEFAQNLLH